MHYLGIEYQQSFIPELDPGYIPFGVWCQAYRKGAAQPIAVAVEREDGLISVRHLAIHGSEAMAQADLRYVERMVKFLLWSIGGFRVYVCGCDAIAQELKNAYSPAGRRAFDWDFFHKVYERELEIVPLPLEQCPQPNESPRPIGGHLDGCRIGFDAGGSDRKVSTPRQWYGTPSCRRI